MPFMVMISSRWTVCSYHARPTSRKGQTARPMAGSLENFSWVGLVGSGFDGDGDALDAGALHKIQNEHHRAMRGAVCAGDVNRQVRIQAITIRQQREQFGKGNGFVVH